MNEERARALLRSLCDWCREHDVAFISHGCYMMGGFVSWDSGYVGSNDYSAGMEGTRIDGHRNAAGAWGET
jgi:hypothetical protein